MGRGTQLAKWEISALLLRFTIFNNVKIKCVVKRRLAPDLSFIDYHKTLLTRLKKKRQLLSLRCNLTGKEEEIILKFDSSGALLSGWKRDQAQTFPHCYVSLDFLFSMGECMLKEEWLRLYVDLWKLKRIRESSPFFLCCLYFLYICYFFWQNFEPLTRKA